MLPYYQFAQKVSWPCDQFEVIVQQAVHFRVAFAFSHLHCLLHHSLQLQQSSSLDELPTSGRVVHKGFQLFSISRG